MTEYLAALGAGLANTLSWPNVLIPLLGTVLAMIVSFLPGIGSASLAAVMVVVTLDWDPVSVLLLFGALTGGATFMGSVTAILFNIPGNATSSVVLLDGHPMAQAGRARTAIAAAATASALGSMFGVLLLVAVLPLVRPLLLEFGPLERVLLAVWGLSTIVAVLRGSPLRALTAAGLGLLLAAVGNDPASSQPRWTFGQFALIDGLDQAAMLVGFFTLSEVLVWRRRYDLRPVVLPPHPTDSVRAGIVSVLRHRALVLQSSLIGTLVGIIPGVGGTVAGFVAYGQTVQTARGDRSHFGKGDIRGVIGPESAVDAKDGGSMLPVVAFGLPGSEGGVFLLSVLTIHGFAPGTAMLSVDLPFTFTLIAALLLSNLQTSALGLALAPSLARLTRLPVDRLALPVLLASLVTVLQLNGMLADLFTAGGFALLGYVFRRLDWPRVPFVIAFVLAPTLEGNLVLVGQLQAAGRLDVLDRPVSWVILALILISLVWMLRRVGGEASGEPDETTLPRRSDRAPAVLLMAVVAGLAVMAVTGGAAYSAYAGTVCLVALGLRELVALNRRRGPDVTDGLEADPLVPVAQRMPLVLLAVFPVAVVLAGLPVASGLLVTLWLGVDRALACGRASPVGPMVAGLSTGLAVTLYCDQVAGIDLPAPFLSVLAGQIL